jgi:hypothetical protein
MNPFFAWLESTAISVWMRESTSIFAFPAVLSAHAVGMALAVGVNAALALRGVAPGVAWRDLQRYVPVMWIGFWLNAGSGVLLLVAYPTKALTNPVFYLKLTLIAAAMRMFVVIARRMFAAEPATGVPGNDRTVATLALTCWVGAITTGRFLAYTATRMLASW